MEYKKQMNKTPQTHASREMSDACGGWGVGSGQNEGRGLGGTYLHLWNE